VEPQDAVSVHVPSSLIPGDRVSRDSIRVTKVVLCFPRVIETKAG
jgi:hypothetical protein